MIKMVIQEIEYEEINERIIYKIFKQFTQFEGENLKVKNEKLEMLNQLEDYLTKTNTVNANMMFYSLEIGICKSMW